MIELGLPWRRKQEPASVVDPAPAGVGVYGEVYEPESRLEYVEAYRDRVTVQRCVNLIRSSAEAVPLRAMRGQGSPNRPHPDDEELEGHSILSLINRPNRRNPAQTFIGESVFWSQVVGDWHWEVVPSRGGQVHELYRMRSHQVKVRKPVEGGLPVGVAYRPRDTEEPVLFEWPQGDPPQIGSKVAISGMLGNPLDDWYGMPPLRGAKDDIVSEYYGVRYDHRFFRNSARPDLIIGFENMNPEQRRANREEWQNFKGVDQAHRAAVMSPTPSVHELGKSPKQVEYLDGRKLAREQQAIAFGVPPVLAGILDRATYSNFDVAERIFWQETMVPLLDYLASWITWSLVPFYPDVDYVSFDYSQVKALQESANELTERLRGQIASGITTPNEGREALEREQVDDPAADRLYLPMTMGPISGTPAELPFSTSGPETNGSGEPAEASEAFEEMSRSISASSRRPKMREKSLAQFRGARAGTLKGLSERAAEFLRAHFAAQEVAVLAAVEGHERATDLVPVLSELDWRGGYGELAGLIGRVHDAAALQSVRQMVELLNLAPVVKAVEEIDWAELEAGWPNLTLRVRRILQEVANRPDGILSVAGRLKEAVLEQVDLGVELGLPGRSVATGGTFTIPGRGDVTLKGIQGVFDEYKTWQAERIARTETAYAYNRASATTMHEAGVTEVDIEDGDQDAACATANGSRWTVDEYEADPLGHPNCTRVGMPVVELGAPAEELVVVG